MGENEQLPGYNCESERNEFNSSRQKKAEQPGKSILLFRCDDEYFKKGSRTKGPCSPLILFLDKPDYKSRQLGKYRYPCTSTKYYASTRIKLARSPEGIFDNKVVPTLTLLLPGTSILFRIENHSTRHLHPFVSVSGKKRIPFNKHTR